MKTEDTKRDFRLGHRVHTRLVELGIETPMIEVDPEDSQRLTKIQQHFKGILEALGMDLADDSLKDTPKRIAKMYLSEVFWGLDYENFPKATVIDNKMQVDEMVLERNVIVNSFCEHHFLNFYGKAHVAYIAKDKVIGLSKMNRIVEFFSRRPQVQERLTSQICEALKVVLGTEDVAVMIEAEHLCVKSRGVQDGCSDTVTSKVSGVFKSSPSAKMEFLSMIALSRRP